ncbi:hypothetical protein [Sphingomicrobium clamense]|uniref:Uncharacterized protein n=1 Tax=Sphingomicrobium clamense TaxID=2851013 RepID=A0ABS6V7G7_9SPHN|nr:hypothetical protein [Sphingomicrobium sp. B8]MBW0145421.1 hypothetical protein [Sphingomicrobium sp. B8]
MEKRFESLLDYGTSAIAGGASGWCCAMLVGSPLAPVAAGGVGFVGVLALMKRVGSGGRTRPIALEPLPLPEFQEPEELLLDQPAPTAVADAQQRIASAFDALAAPAAEHDVDEDVLLLDDPLPRDDNRVVALFGGERGGRGDPAKIKARIDAHLAAGEGPRPPAPGGPELVPDASDALAAALKGLRSDKG